MKERAGPSNAFTVATFAFREDVHNAWRSAVTDSSEVLALDDVWGTPDARALCASTSQLVFHLVEEQVVQKQDLDASVIYGMMERLYVQYSIQRHRYQSAENYRENGLELSLTMSLFGLIQNGTFLGGRTDYADKLMDYREKDRRILMVGFASLADPLYRQIYWDEKYDILELLDLPGIGAAAADGGRILSSVRTGISYDQSLGFAIEAVDGVCPPASEGE